MTAGYRADAVKDFVESVESLVHLGRGDLALRYWVFAEHRGRQRHRERLPVYARLVDDPRHFYETGQMP